MEYLTDIMKPEDWQQVRSIYLEGIGTGNSTFEADAPGELCVKLDFDC
jgi:hypothetical protein